ncbi:MAG: phosphoribosylamine--glycine ligase [Myxococcales bacterium]|nr:phosphoribosylamine--glycine ligase [Myxococcales bacterium]
MKVLVVGQGGREHAIAWKIARSPQLTRLYCAPGNAGTETVAENVPIAADAVDALVGLAEREAIDLVVIGPEQPLTLGLADRLRAAGIAALGPNRAAAELEASKSFAKELMRELGVPTARFASFDRIEAALSYLAGHPLPLVVKADGLAAGKGVTICPTQEAAEAALREAMHDGRFGAAGRRVVIEEFLDGEEASYIVLTDGRAIVPLAASQDHKAAYDGDRGPNTGGMGAYSPAPVVDAALEARVLERVIRPVVDGMRAKGRPLNGFLYAGLMIGSDGPKVLEFNVRLGDPETQPLMLRLESDLLPALYAAATGSLEGTTLVWSPEPAVCVVLASEGYPESSRTGLPIAGLPADCELPDGVVFHAGTRREGTQVLTSGGRVLGVTTRGADYREAVANAYRAIESISFDGMSVRRDIAWRALERS